MLSQLIISNIAVISKCDITLFEGFNVLTGETGAGKSLIIDSLNMVLGERGNRELIRHGEKKAKVEALFYLGNEEKRLLEAEVGEFDGNEFTVSREIFDDGRNLCRINGEIATVARLKQIAHYLVNIHGQNDGQKLLSKVNHIEFLDEYAENNSLLSEYKSIYKECKSIEKEIESIKTDESEKLKRLDSLRFWLDEIDSAGLSENEEEELLTRLRIIKNSEKLKRGVMQTCESIYGGDVSAYNFLNAAVENLSDAAECDEGLKPMLDELSDMLYRVQDISRELSSYGDGLEYDGGELSEMEERLYLIQKLKTKYGSSISEILAYAESLREEIKNIEFSEEREAELIKKLEKAKSDLRKAADMLSERRAAAAEKIDAGVKEELMFLDMEKVSFTVRIDRDELGAMGQDKVEFLVSTNPSEPLKALTSIASGGEMSRICLAIKSVLADADGVSTLIFDEIDTGVSGKAAGKIGSKLKSLGEKKQVICITHLPQIAALGQNHYLIEKSFKDDTFETDVHILSEEERVLEIARIISGDAISESAKKAAEEMIKF